MGEHEKHAHRACFSCLKEGEGGGEVNITKDT